MYTTLTAIPAELTTQTADFQPKKILFACMSADGHFNPLTSLAMALKDAGHNVRWYTGNTYKAKLAKMGIPHYPFVKAPEVTLRNMDEVFPERKNLKGHLSKLRFDIINYFILLAPKYYEDIRELEKEFPFDLMVADNAFSAIPFIKDKMKKKVVCIGVTPLSETSKDLPAAGMGLTPAKGPGDRIMHRLHEFMGNMMLFNKANAVMNNMMREHGMSSNGYNIYDTPLQKSDIVLQSGTPGFEYYRSDVGKHIRFIGPLLPYRANNAPAPLHFADKLAKYKKVLLVSQGTMEADSTKLIIPVLEAYKNTEFLVIATTAGCNTDALRKRFKYDNCIIEDFIPFSQVLPFVSVFITNGGYGSVLLGISAKAPMVVAGVHEGKNEICARVGYFRLGINLRTERPSQSRIRKAVEKVMADSGYKERVSSLAREFEKYNPQELCVAHVEKLLNTGKRSSARLLN